MPAVQEGFSPEALEANFAQLAANPYPGRFIAQGITRQGEFVQAYAIMGRSEGSRNRVFETFADVNGTEGVRTAPYEVKEGEDHSLTIYNAMRAVPYRGFIDAHIVTNGEQTDDLVRVVKTGSGEGQNPRITFVQALDNWGYEPDKPNWTPRINALLDPDSGWSVMSYQKKSHKSFKIERVTHRSSLAQAGAALCLHTYDSDGDPLPSFTGNPYFIPVGETVEDTADMLWDVLDADNKVSLAVKAAGLHAGAIILKNKHLGD